MKGRKLRISDVIPLFENNEIIKATAKNTDVVIKMAFSNPGVWEPIADLYIVGIRRRSDCIELVVDMGIRSTRRKTKDEQV